MRYVIPILCLGLVGISTLQADESSSNAPKCDDTDTKTLSIWQKTRLLDCPLREKMEDKGYCICGNYIAESLSNVSGGMKEGTIFEGRLRLDAEINLEKAADWKGGLVHASTLWMHGDSVTQKYTRDIMTVSNIDAYDSLKLFELWYQQSFFDDLISLRIGQLAADEEFSTHTYSGSLLNGVFGWLPSISLSNAASPAFPSAAPGVRLKIQPIEQVYLQAAVFDGNPNNTNASGKPMNASGTNINLNEEEGAFAIFEAGYLWNQEKDAKGLPGTYKLGGWIHTAMFGNNRIDSTGLSLADPGSSGAARAQSGNYGIYAMGDQMVYREKDDQGLALFARLGLNRSDVSQVDLAADAGINYKGLIPDRDNDILSIGVAYSKISNSLRELDQDNNAFGTYTPLRDYEAVVEATYVVQITPWWSVQPDFQYVIHPGGKILNPLDTTGTQTIDDAVVVGLRTTISL
jgi:porin